MNTEPSECVRCRVYETEAILLRAELAGLKQSVLSLTEPPVRNLATLEMVDMHQPGRLLIAGPILDGTDRYCEVSLAYRDTLAARCLVLITDPASFARFFDDIEKHKSGWDGVKRIANAEEQFAICCNYEGKQFRPEISVDIECSLDSPSFDPPWRVRLHLDVDPNSLQAAGERARSIFG